jgi:predicted dehydrogenase
MTTLRIGFLGTGYIASTHAKALAKIADVQIAALCNHHIEKAEAFNQNFAGGKAACYDDFDRMLNAEKLDVLYVCLPPGAHQGQTQAAAARGIHLCLEKPIALTEAEAQSMYDAIKQAGVKCQIGHHMRHTGPAIKLKQMLADGSAGKPLMLQGRFFVNCLFPKWWRDPMGGGGQLIEQSIHIYDQARYFLGEAESAFGFNDNLNHKHFEDYKVDDVSASVVRFKNGALASICAANCADPKGGEIDFSVMCEKVYVQFHSINDATFIFHDGKPSEHIQGDVKREKVTSEHNCYEELNRNFIAGIRDGEPLRSGIEDGLESLRLVLACAAASKTRQLQSL